MKNEDILRQVKERMYQKEKFLSVYASKNDDSIRLFPFNEDMRPPYYHDIDRIVYSLSYTRYIDKTQVFSNINNNDHISKRMTHVQMVSKIARTIGRALNLNEDLIEAIALGHDLGHVPFGHEGERILNLISLENNEGYFNHNVQSVRTLMNLEKDGNGANISVQVLDGILCHNGELVQKEYVPISKTKEQFIKEYNDCYRDQSVIKKLRPMTLEGCVVRISDVIGYIGRDIEDAIRLGILEKKDLPDNIITVLGDHNSQIVNTIVLDIIENSFDKPYIKMSEEVAQAVIDLKNFNYQYIYSKANSEKEKQEFEKMFRTLFASYLNQINNQEIDNDIFVSHLNEMSENYNKTTTPARKVIDYLAGMTDDYFINQYNKIAGEDYAKNRKSTN